MTHRTYVAALGLALLTFPLYSQQLVPHDTKPDSTIRLDGVVTDRAGKAVSGLAKDRFKLLDNGVPRETTSFKEVVTPAEPVSLLIVVDAVNAPYSAVSSQRQQIAKYLRANEGQLTHVTNFAVLTDKGVKMFQQPSKDGNALASAMDHVDIGLRVIGRDQGVYGAEDRLTISLNALRQIEAYEKNQPGRKLVAWTSAGWPLLSGPRTDLDKKQEDAIYNNIVGFSTQLRAAGITLYSVDSWGAGESLGRVNYYEVFLNGVKKPADAQFGNLGLQVLATQSGGLVLNSNDLVQMLQQSVADADDYYQLSFEAAPSDQPKEYHKIQVLVDGLKTRTRQGYYTAPQD